MLCPLSTRAKRPVIVVLVGVKRCKGHLGNQTHLDDCCHVSCLLRIVAWMQARSSANVNVATRDVHVYFNCPEVNEKGARTCVIGVTAVNLVEI
jgi:hypothetical protein